MNTSNNHIYVDLHNNDMHNVNNLSLSELENLVYQYGTPNEIAILNAYSEHMETMEENSDELSDELEHVKRQNDSLESELFDCQTEIKNLREEIIELKEKLSIFQKVN